MSPFADFLRTIFWALVLLYTTPALVRNIRTVYANLLEQKAKIGVVSIKETPNDPSFYAKQCKQFFEDPEIKAIVLSINGTTWPTSAAQALFAEITSLKKMNIKPVVAWSATACSGSGYYVACAADAIITTPAAVIGGIKATLPTTTPRTSFDAENYQELVTQLAELYLHDVVEQRPQLAGTAKNLWADGKVFSGQKALTVGLIDEIGTQQNVEDFIRHKTQIEGTLEWVTPPCSPLLFDWLGLSEFTSGMTSCSSTTCSAAGSSATSALSTATN